MADGPETARRLPVGQASVRRGSGEGRGTGRLEGRVEPARGDVCSEGDRIRGGMYEKYFRLKWIKKTNLPII